MNNELMKQIGSFGGAVTEAMKEQAKNMEELNEKQDEIILALATIYKAIECIAVKQKVSLPKPLVNMDIENMEGRK